MRARTLTSAPALYTSGFAAKTLRAEPLRAIPPFLQPKGESP
jgi:hypothetical protein